MSNTPAAFWDERYTENDTVYGLQPNLFFKEQIDKLNTGSLLLPCEGEGRNAVYAAKKGWQVDAFDFSEAAVIKTLKRAAKENVSMQYVQKRIEDFSVEKKYDLIASVYVHLPEALRKIFHRQLIGSLEDNGMIILEAFNKEQINYQSGGPRDINLMYSTEELQNDFAILKIELLEEKKLVLQEGDFHKGEAAVIRMVAYKK